MTVSNDFVFIFYDYYNLKQLLYKCLKKYSNWNYKCKLEYLATTNDDSLSQR